MKIYKHDAGHMTKMAATPFMVKTLQKSSPELGSDFHNTGYIALRTPAHYSLFK